MIFKLYYLSCDCDSGVQVRKYISSENFLKGIGCERNMLHGASSNYPQTAGKRNLYMHNCEGECCWIVFLAPEAMQVGQGLLKHEIPWFFRVGAWYWT